MRRLLVGLTLLVLLASGCTPVSPEAATRARSAKLGIDGAPVQLQLAETPRTMSPFAPIGSAELRLAQVQFLPFLAGGDGALVARFAAIWQPLQDGRVLLVYTPRLRWSDGTWMSAADVMASFEAHLDPRSHSPFANELLAIRGAEDFRAGRAEHVSGIVVDEFRRLVITLDEPNPHYIDHLTQIPIMPSHVYPSRDAMVTADYREARVGSGPFVLDRWEPDGSVRFALNPLLAAKADESPPRLLGLVARPVAPADVGAAMAEGRLDVADSHPLRPGALPAGVRLESAPGNTLVTLTPAPGRLTDKRVRRAIMAAIDRRGLVADALGGRGRAADSLLFQSEWTNPADGPGWPAYDPAYARRLLAEAGWDPAQKLRIAVVAESRRAELWQKVAEQLRASGIDAEIATFDPHDQTGLAESRDYDLLAGQWTAPMRHPSLVTGLVRCGGTVETNTGQYCNPRLDAELRDANASTTTAEEVARWRTVSATLADEMPIIPLFVPDSVIAASATMAPIDPTLVPLTGKLDFWSRTAA